MPEYQAPLKDMKFAINELADINLLNDLPGFEDATPDMVGAILEQAAVLANEVFSPLNQPGDEHGAFIEDGLVVIPPGFADAYRQFSENGWQGLSQSPDYDGQGMPYLVQSAVSEMWVSSNMSLALCPLLTSGAIEALFAHASEALKQTYLAKMVSAEWSGTMNLTEPQAGSDLSAVRTKAVPDGDHYRITGQKIFITWGAHEMAKNIVHLVLARLPDAPEGIKGISLFLVPKFLLDSEGNVGEHNDLKVVSLESKMGIHACPTCVMSYGDQGGALGYLVGEPHNGLACMFTMMNHARLEVGIQGVGLCERAYQHALAFARERVQGSIAGQEGRVTIIHHADVRRMLMQMRALSESTRALSYVAASAYDQARRSPGNEAGQRAQRRIDLLTPVAKGWCTEIAQEVTYLGVQVHGGMGFIEETGAAQYMRDARIVTIYEGTTGIQAMDLVGRKILRDQGQAIGELIAEMKLFKADLDAQGDEFKSMQVRFASALEALETTTLWYLEQVSGDPDLPGSIAVNYMMLVGYVVTGWLMAKSAIAAKRIIDRGSNDIFYRNKISTATFFCEHIVPRAEGLKSTVLSGSVSTMSIDIASF